MANTVRIKRRAAGGAAGAPATLENAELAFNEQDDTLYYGKGAGGAGGTATTIEAIGGKGAFVALTGNQTIAGTKTFSSSPVVPTPTQNGHAVTKEYADGLVPNITGGDGITVTPSGGSVTIAVDNTVAKLASPAFTGAPTAPTAAAATNTTQIATTAFVKAQNYITASGSISGNALTATKLQTERSISITGDASWTVNFDGSANATAALTLASTGISPGAYAKVTVDAKGRVTAGAALAASDIPTLTAAKISDFNSQVRLNRLDQMAAAGADVTLAGFKLTNVGTPVADTDVANKGYVDMAVQGLSPKQSVRAASVSNIAALSGTMTIDGVALIAGDRILVKNQTTAHQNGIYVVAAGAWSRAPDANTWAELVSAFMFVEEGTDNKDRSFIITVDQGGTLGTTPVTVVDFLGASEIIAGNGIVRVGNTVSAKSGNSTITIDGDGIKVGGILNTLAGQLDAYKVMPASGLPVFLGQAAGADPAHFTLTFQKGLTRTGNATVSYVSTVGLLPSLSQLSPAANKLAYFTGTAEEGSAALADFTAFARNLLDDADASTARGTLGLGTIATQAANNVAITGGAVSNITLDNVVIDGGTF